MNFDNNISAIERALAYLLQKYNVPTGGQVYRLTPVLNGTANCLLPGWKFLGNVVPETHIPLMPWRSKRKFIELRNLVQHKVVQHPSLLRFCFFTDNSWTIEAQLYRELDIVEFVTGSRVETLYAVLNANNDGNVIARLSNGILCSIELSNQLPQQSPIVDRHEIICERGVASDTVVDTQIPQSSVYLFTEKGRSEYSDNDAELYGLQPDEIDLVRAAYNVLNQDSSIDEHISQHRHLEVLVRCALKSGVENRKINTSDTLIYETN